MIAGLHKTSRSAVQADHAGSRIAADRVGHLPGTVFNIDDLHLLVFHDACRCKELRVNCDAADVIQIGLFYDRPVNFTFQHCDIHVDSSSG